MTVSDDFERFMTECNQKLAEIELLQEDCIAERHVLSKGRCCKNCGIPICTHHKYSLRGCMLPQGHQGPHINMWGEADQPWEDSEGIYVTSREIWGSLIDQIGKTRH